MAVSAPFTPTGNTVTFTAANVAPSTVQAVSTTIGGNQYRLRLAFYRDCDGIPAPSQVTISITSKY